MSVGIGAWIAFALIGCALAAPPAWALWPGRRAGGKAEAVLLGALLGIPLFVILAHFALLGGARAGKGGMLAVYASEWLACAALRRFSPPRSAGLAPIPHERRVVLWTMALSLGAFMTAFYAFSEPFYDSLVYWVGKGWTISISGDARIFPATHAPAYPLAIPFAHALFMAFDNPVGVACWQRAFFLGSLLYAALYLARRFGWPGLLAAVLPLPAQVLVCERGGIGIGLYADVTQGAALLLAAVLLMEILDSAAARAWPAACALCFFVLVKVNAASYLPCVALAFAAALPSSVWREAARAKRLALCAAILIPPLLAIAGWKLALWLWRVPPGVEGVAADVLRLDILGSSNPLAVYAHKLSLSLSFFVWLFALDRPLTMEFFARLGWTVAAPPLALLAWRALAARERFACLAATGLFAFLVAVMYCLVRADDDAEADWWFRGGYLRTAVHLLPMGVLASQAIMARLLADGLKSKASGDPLCDPAKDAPAPSRLWLAYLLPVVVALLLLFRPKGGSDWRALFGSYLSTQPFWETGLPYGLHEPEPWEGARIRWTSGKTSFRFIRRGDNLRVSYWLNHPDLSPEHPVTVSIAVEGSPPRSTTHDSPGYFATGFDLGEFEGSCPRFKMECSRTWTARDGRVVGAALFPFEWD